MKITVLGSGTSVGVPMVGCDCPVCTSTDPRNRRYRPSVLVSHANHHVLVDTSPDLRSQALRFHVVQVDAVLFTHHHADHILGLDDLRSYNLRLRRKLPCYADRPTLDRLRVVFDYAFDDRDSEQSRPALDPHEIGGPFPLFGLTITPIPLTHGRVSILGFLFEDGLGNRFGYATDCNAIPDGSAARLAEIDLLILDALRYDRHPTHFSLGEAVDAVKRLRPRQALLTHIAHQIDHASASARLPPGIQIAYDGQTIDLGSP